MSENQLSESNPALIPASPAKSFFVEMITRDIELQDAILDLLDNCVDGVRRTGKMTGAKPYKNYFAHITLAEDKFMIEDNCGGIPLDIAKKYAFMMGRPASHKDSKSGTIGIYGIGMKRAIFKMGRACTVHSHHKDDSFEIRISEDWLDDDKDWDLHAVPASSTLNAYGTRITIEKLHQTISDDFADGSDFRKHFVEFIRDAYSFLLEKGFEVKVNGENVIPHLPELLWDVSSDKNAIRPYIYEAEIDSVNIFLAIGFRERPKTQDDDPAQYRSEDAGWSIVCNDRVILPFDKGRQTGWGWGGVPSYHTQFIAISGFVLFEGDAAKLPMTTTKRGVDANSELYTTVRERMQEGLLHFTKFTNDWKGFEIDQLFRKAKQLDVAEIRRRVDKERLTKLNGQGTQKQLVPNLPRRSVETHDQRISYTRATDDIKAVSKFLFDTEDMKPSKVGEESFDFVLRKTR